jgi:hypothetical protein
MRIYKARRPLISISCNWKADGQIGHYPGNEKLPYGNKSPGPYDPASYFQKSKIKIGKDAGEYGDQGKTNGKTGEPAHRPVQLLAIAKVLLCRHCLT